MFDKLFGKNVNRDVKSNRWTFIVMLAFGITGLIAAFILAVEEFQLLKNPNTILSCSINLVLNCGAVMKTPQAAAFGFPNMFIGLMGFPIVITIAILGLSQVKLPKWFLIGANIGYVFWTLFAYWLFFSSVYVIQVLCPWCLVVTFSMTMLSASITHYNLKNHTFDLSKSLYKKIDQFIAKDYDKLAVAAWVVLLVALVIAKFGEALVA
ncbi:MAG: hypothetical protein JWN75_606 [Candidatus Saccharibacteria bacterium]|nr:hypothetical protein [Candidatus Saccharibacteria bacterium]